MMTLQQPISGAVTLADAKSHLRVEISHDDEIINNLILVATSMAEHELGRALITQSIKLELNRFPRKEIELDMPPVQSITSIRYLDENGVLQTLSSAQYELVKDPIRPIVKAVQWPRGTKVEVIYGAGFGDVAAIPAEIKQWILVQIASMYENRESFGKQLEKIPFVDALLARYLVPRR